MTEHRVVISLGSNIDPEVNVKRALKELKSLGRIVKESTFVYTEPLLYKDQPKFLNGAVLLATCFNRDALRRQLKTIETNLGRTRTPDKNGPRIIDLDIILFDGAIINDDYYNREFLRKMVKEVVELIP